MSIIQLFLNRFIFTDASGGTKLEPGNGFVYHVFTSPGELVFTKAISPVNVDYLVIAGGGGGGGMQLYPPGSYGSGGGGAGGVLSGIVTATEGNTYTIQVGSGGPGGTNGPPAARGTSGNPSHVLGPVGFTSITSFGGGGGGAGILPPSPTATNGAPGGSGGGGGSNARPGGTGTPGQGYPGGTVFVTGNLGAGGGGGSGGAGAGSINGTTGGIAAAYPKFPAPVIAPAIPSPVRPGWTPLVGPGGYFASGGNGGSSTSPLTVIGGAGPNSPIGRNAIEHTGAGGGGCRGGTPALGLAGGKGGNGIIIFRYSIL
jgi:hypothetical protein